MLEEIRNIPSKVPLEQFDVSAFSKEKIRDLFRMGKLPTADAMLDEIILRAIKEAATDLHIEPCETEIRVRIGFDGVMKKLVYLPKEIADNLASVSKTKGNLNAFEKKKPQEGRFSFALATHQFDVRISTVPVMYGERITFRFFGKNNKVSRIEELGFADENLAKVRKLLRRPNGLLLVTGPSSSGKSTTAYAAVNDLQTAEMNIITVEDPIEFKLDFASQVPASNDKSFPFADALRAILHQNPKVIMLGEIRDAETGVVAAEAALTGNLILSTMLAGDAVGAIYRLLNFGITPFWLASTLIGVIHQQLIRKICDNCREEVQPAPDKSSLFNGTMQMPSKFYRGKGCDKCSGTGYSGRTAIHEVLTMNDEIRDLIYKQASLMSIKETAKASGFENIIQDALKKVASGVTSIEEFSRTLG